MKVWCSKLEKAANIYFIIQCNNTPIIKEVHYKITLKKMIFRLSDQVSSLILQAVDFLEKLEKHSFSESKKLCDHKL